MHHDSSRRYGSSASETAMGGDPNLPPGFPSTSEDLHAWSIYRQNLNSDFTDSALGSSEKSPMPYGNFQLRETTMQSILNNPKYGPKSELGTNMYTYLKFGLPRVLPPNKHGEGGPHSSGYDSTDEDLASRARAASAVFHDGSGGRLRAARSEDFLSAVGGERARRSQQYQRRDRGGGGGGGGGGGRSYYRDEEDQWRERRLKSVSEANLLDRQYHYEGGAVRGGGASGGQLRPKPAYRSNGHLSSSQHELLQNGAFVNRGLEHDEDLDDEDDLDEEDERVLQEVITAERRSASRLAKAASHMSLASRHSRATHLQNGGGVSYRHEAPMLNDKYFPRDYLSNGYLNGGTTANGDAGYDGFKYPHLQLRNVSFDTKNNRILDSITMEARGGELVAIMATKRKWKNAYFFSLFLHCA